MFSTTCVLAFREAVRAEPSPRLVATPAEGEVRQAIVELRYMAAQMRAEAVLLEEETTRLRGTPQPVAPTPKAIIRERRVVATPTPAPDAFPIITLPTNTPRSNGGLLDWMLNHE